MTLASEQVPSTMEWPDYVKLFQHSPQMRGVQRIIAEVVGTNAAVLIRGESGVGKDVVARAIHAASDRRHRPWVKVNCAALPAELPEREAFYTLHQKFPDVSVATLYQVVYEHHDGPTHR